MNYLKQETKTLLINEMCNDFSIYLISALHEFILC